MVGFKRNFQETEQVVQTTPDVNIKNPFKIEFGTCFKIM